MVETLIPESSTIDSEQMEILSGEIKVSRTAWICLV